MVWVKILIVSLIVIFAAVVGIMVITVIETDIHDKKKGYKIICRGKCCLCHKDLTVKDDGILLCQDCVKKLKEAK
jgi:hypothetical protein